MYFKAKLSIGDKIFYRYVEAANREGARVLIQGCFVDMARVLVVEPYEGSPDTIEGYVIIPTSSVIW